jgi:hypothetical protein
MFVGHFYSPGFGSGYGYGSRDPIESGSNPHPDMDPDTQHCLEGNFLSVYTVLTTEYIFFLELKQG